MNLRLSLTSWSLPYCTLPECAGISRALGIEAIDLSYFYRSALDKERLLSHPEQYAAEVVSKFQISLASLYHLFGDTISDRNLSNPDAMVKNLADFESVLRFCGEAGVASILLLPGLVNPGQTRQDALDISSEALKMMRDKAARTDVTLTIELHVHSYLESPSLVLELLGLFQGLRLTLDYAHFHCLGYRQEEIDLLTPHAAHVHLRQRELALSRQS